MKKLIFRKLIAAFLLVTIFAFLFGVMTKAGFNQPTDIVKGSQFNLYFPSGSTLCFQHLESGYLKGYIASVEVISGVLNGTDAQITMRLDSGELTFTSRDTATLKPSLGVAIFVNGERDKSSIVAGDTVRLVWANPYPIKPLFPVMFMFGILGLGSLLASPLYFVYKYKRHEYYEGFRTGIILFGIGMAFFISWLWG